MTKTKKRLKIFSGPDSAKMWDELNNAKTIGQLKDALFTVLCKLQHLEHQISSGKG